MRLSIMVDASMVVLATICTGRRLYRPLSMQLSVLDEASMVVHATADAAVCTD